jgi:uncharacterized protein (DUF58 family)
VTALVSDPAPTHPERATRAHGPGELTLAAVVLFALGAYGIAAGSVTGEQRAVAMGIFAFTLFTAGIVWPIITLSRVAISVVAPTDAVVGDEVRLRVTISGRASRVEVRVLDPSGRWWRTSVPTEGIVPHIATRRGVFDHVRVQIRTSAPLGVFLRTRQARVALPSPITIAPQPLASGIAMQPVPPRVDSPSPQTVTGTGSDVVRAVRPYVAGDPARLVHWPTSARLGSLVVREHDPPANDGVALVVDLTGPSDAAETAASVAAGVGRAVLARGGRLLVSTIDLNGPRIEAVTDARELGRRLARAVAGAPDEPPATWPVQHVRALDMPNARERSDDDALAFGPRARPELLPWGTD